MTNTDAGGPLTSESKPPRSKIANRDWIDASGQECDEENAVAIRYEFLGRDDVPADGKSFTQRYDDLSDAAKRMFCHFGQITLAGNVTNTWLGEKGDDKAATAAEAIAARWALIGSGTWIDRTREGVGARVDRDALAQAVVNVMTAAGKAADLAAWRGKLDDAEVVKAVRSNGAIAAEYASIMGRSVKTLDDLESLVK